MGMILCLRRVTDAQIEALLAEPGLIQPLLWGADYDPRPAAPGLLAKLFRLTPRQSPPRVELPADWPEPEERDETDLDKAWHGIHYLLTGSDWAGDPPLCYLLAGGEEVGDIDVGYGPARVLRSAQARAFHEALAGLPDDQLAGRYDPAAMTDADLYPSIWADTDSEPLEYLMEYLGDLRGFVAETAERGLGLVIWLC